MSRKRGGRGSGKTRKQAQIGAPVHDSALGANIVDQQEYLNWILDLCLLRYEWTGLPDTCSERFLETSLATTGSATLAFEMETPNLIMSLQAGAYSQYNAYNDPVLWWAMGMGTSERKFFEVQRGVNGVFIWDRYSRLCFWPKLTRLAAKLTRYSRAEDVNLFQQMTPYIVTAPDEKVLDIQTVLGAIGVGQPAIVGYEGLADTISKGINVLQTGVEWKGEQFQRGALGVWSEIFRLIGIPHVMFEKTERMNTDETQTAYAPARMMLDDGLKARKIACEEWNRSYGGNIDVRVNPFVEEMYKGGDNNDAGIRDAGDTPGMAR